MRYIQNLSQPVIDQMEQRVKPVALAAANILSAAGFKPELAFYNAPDSVSGANSRVLGVDVVVEAGDSRFQWLRPGDKIQRIKPWAVGSGLPRPSNAVVPAFHMWNQRIDGLICLTSGIDLGGGSHVMEFVHMVTDLPGWQLMLVDPDRARHYALLAQGAAENVIKLADERQGLLHLMQFEEWTAPQPLNSQMARLERAMRA